MPIEVQRSIYCLPNDPMLNIWLNMKNNHSMKQIKNRGMSCNAYGFLRLLYKYELRKYSQSVVFILSRDKHVPVKFWYPYFTRKVNLPKRENFQNSNLYHRHRNSLPGAIIFYIQPDVEHWIVWYVWSRKF